MRTVEPTAVPSWFSGTRRWNLPLPCAGLFLLLSGIGALGQSLPSVELRSQQLQTDEEGRNTWKTTVSCRDFEPSETALLICDMWNRHWSRGATLRVEEMAPLVDQLARVLRSKGVLIIHSPSETEDFYSGSAALRRARAIRLAPAPAVKKLTLPPLPIDDSDGGSDTGEKPWFKAWTRQHPSIYIDDARDFISADGDQIYSVAAAKGIRTLFFCGVHTNMCVLRSRTFSLKPMAERGLEVVLVRDLTDTMYNPARPPYVNHDEGTRLVVDYIEKYVCPSVSSRSLMKLGNRP